MIFFFSVSLSPLLFSSPGKSNSWSPPLLRQLSVVTVHSGAGRVRVLSLMSKLFAVKFFRQAEGKLIMCLLMWLKKMRAK